MKLDIEDMVNKINYYSHLRLNELEKFNFKLRKITTMVDLPTQLDEEEMQAIYNWVDEIPLSRPKRNIARDFSDGGKLIFSISLFFPISILNLTFSFIVLTAEVVKHFIPNLVELHNYSAAHSVS